MAQEQFLVKAFFVSFVSALSYGSRFHQLCFILFWLQVTYFNMAPRDVVSYLAGSVRVLQKRLVVLEALLGASSGLSPRLSPTARDFFPRVPPGIHLPHADVQFASNFRRVLHETANRFDRADVGCSTTFFSNLEQIMPTCTLTPALARPPLHQFEDSFDDMNSDLKHFDDQAKKDKKDSFDDMNSDKKHFDDQAKKEKKVQINMYFEEWAEHDLDDDGDENDSDEWRLRRIMGNKEYEHMEDSMAVSDDEFENG